MAALAENRPGGAQAERPKIETIGAAAVEITRLFGIFDKVAVDVTPEYLRAQLAGEKGVTWDTFRGWPNRHVPFLAPITRREGRIELGAGFTFGGPIRAEYRLQQTPLLVPEEEGKFTKVGAVTLREPAVGFDPGQEYLAFDEHVLKAGYRHQRSVPTVGQHGGLAWSTPRDYIGDTYGEMDAITPDLQKLIAKVQAYEPTH